MLVIVSCRQRRKHESLFPADLAMLWVSPAGLVSANSSAGVVMLAGLNLTRALHDWYYMNNISILLRS